MPERFKSLEEILRTEPGLKGLRKIIKSSDVVLDFYKIFPDLKKIAVPKKVDKMFLKLKVDNPTWRSELKYREKEIVDKINKYYNEERVKGISFTNR